MVPDPSYASFEPHCGLSAAALPLRAPSTFRAHFAFSGDDVSGCHVDRNSKSDCKSLEMASPCEDPRHQTAGRPSGQDAILLLLPMGPLLDFAAATLSLATGAACTWITSTAHFWGKHAPHAGDCAACVARAGTQMQAFIATATTQHINTKGRTQANVLICIKTVMTYITHSRVLRQYLCSM